MGRADRAAAGRRHADRQSRRPERARTRRRWRRRDVIAAEDTRHTGALLKALGIADALLSLHEHNESRRVPALLARLAPGRARGAGERCGHAAAVGSGIRVGAARRGGRLRGERHPGPLGDHRRARRRRAADRPLLLRRFPAGARARAPRSARRRSRTSDARWCSSRRRTASRRRSPTWRPCSGAEREAVVARELTKAHETIYRGTLRELARARRRKRTSRAARSRSSCTARAARRRRGVDERLLRRTVEVLSKELPPGRVAAVAAQLTGATRAAAYALARRGPAGGAEGAQLPDEADAP